MSSKSYDDGLVLIARKPEIKVPEEPKLCFYMDKDLFSKYIDWFKDYKVESLYSKAGDFVGIRYMDKNEKSFYKDYWFTAFNGDLVYYTDEYDRRRISVIPRMSQKEYVQV